MPKIAMHSCSLLRSTLPIFLHVVDTFPQAPLFFTARFSFRSFRCRQTPISFEKIFHYFLFCRRELSLYRIIGLRTLTQNIYAEQTAATITTAAPAPMPPKNEIARGFSARICNHS